MSEQVRDPTRHVLTQVVACRSCGQKVYFGLTAKGKRCPFDVDDQGEPTTISHFTTCTDPKRWTRR